MRLQHLLVCWLLCWPLLAYLSPSDFDSLATQVPRPLYSVRNIMGTSHNGNNLAVYTLSRTLQSILVIEHSRLVDLQGRKAILLSSEMHAR